ncbi:unnamed protein product [Candida verbasci]|uniref:RNA polymerase II subunit A C-terminal domain phosphatase SSU72 n=1 Tax=Candida verbasci TaxID=1227364 RepID=A0A9W4TRP4_9ASCO|nr:unnamed protein product [Candida verbasci]
MSIQDNLKICTVCASNQNRSMEAHKQLKEYGYDVHSYGTGSKVRLPGPSIDKPNVYDFGTPYEKMIEDLISQKNNKDLYIQNGLLAMLDRNKRIKDAPEKWEFNAIDGKFDLVITCEERCFDSVVEDLMFRMYSNTADGANDNKQIVHIINVDIKDDNENAIIGGKGILKLVNMIDDFKKKQLLERENDEVEDKSDILLEDQMMNILTEWQKDHIHLQTLYTVSYY